MRAILLSTMVVIFLLFCTNRIQAQTTQTKLNQVELMKQYIGTWKKDIGKDTTVIFEVKSFKNEGLEIKSKTINKGKIIYEGRSLQGYDKKSDKYINVGIEEEYPPAISFYSIWFSSENICELSFDVGLSNPEKVTIKSKIEFKSTDLFIQTVTENNKVILTYTITRVKN